MRLLLFVVFISCISLNAQNNYPQDYFGNPLDVTLVLSGTFAELRANHFHSGMDIKTQQRVGLNVLASADGFVSRIKVSHFGYGKALYLTHPNGYTTVYAHLQKFAPGIEALVKKEQYEKESYEVEFFPNLQDVLVEKGEIIAYNTSSYHDEDKGIKGIFVLQPDSISGKVVSLGTEDWFLLENAKNEQLMSILHNTIDYLLK